MIPQSKHTQPLLHDLSVQTKGPYLLTVYGQTNRKYVYLNSYIIEKDVLRFATSTGTWGALPVAAAWTIYPSDLMEYPTFEDLARQEVEDQKTLAHLRSELFPGQTESQAKVVLVDQDTLNKLTGGGGGPAPEPEVPEWYKEQRDKQYL